eukprot:m.586485 g.586485  ORF g.586485 m.586485 type:complete len:155 (-) comp22344_c1_seq3:244-708(-)
MPPTAITDGLSPVLGGNGTCGGILRKNDATLHDHKEPTTACSSQGSGKMFYGMISPLTTMELRGVLWYQGEENDHPTDPCYGPELYGCLFPSMITYWREMFAQPNLPFYYVLLAAGHTALMREAQMNAQVWHAMHLHPIFLRMFVVRMYCKYFF